MSEPTPVQLQAWDAYLASSSMKEAAAKLGVHEQTVKRRIGDLRDVFQVKTNAQLAIAIERSRAA